MVCSEDELKNAEYIKTIIPDSEQDKKTPKNTYSEKDLEQLIPQFKKYFCNLKGSHLTFYDDTGIQFYSVVCIFSFQIKIYSFLGVLGEKTVVLDRMRVPKVIEDGRYIFEIYVLNSISQTE
jgi:hypothetical protein